MEQPTIPQSEEETERPAISPNGSEMSLPAISQALEARALNWKKLRKLIWRASMEVSDDDENTLDLDAAEVMILKFTALRI